MLVLRVKANFNAPLARLGEHSGLLDLRQALIRGVENFRCESVDPFDFEKLGARRSQREIINLPIEPRNGEVLYIHGFAQAVILSVLVIYILENPVQNIGDNRSGSSAFYPSLFPRSIVKSSFYRHIYSNTTHPTRT